MSLEVLSFSRHRNLTWVNPPGYFHAAGRNLIGLAAGEVAKAALALPLAFVCQNDQWSLCAFLGLEHGDNLYVAPDGQWIGAYVPAAVRAHPFHLGWNGTEANLCIDVDSGLLPSDGTGEPIFDEQGGLSRSVAQVWEFLSVTATGLLALEEVSELLAKTGVIEPWPITINSDGQERALEGLYRIGEAALKGLDGAEFLKLRDTGALGVAYAQLISMGNLLDLGKLAQARAQIAAQASAEAARQAAAPPLITLPDDSSIDWDWSKIGR